MNFIVLLFMSLASFGASDVTRPLELNNREMLTAVTPDHKDSYPEYCPECERARLSQRKGCQTGYNNLNCTRVEQRVDLQTPAAGSDTVK